MHLLVLVLYALRCCVKSALRHCQLPGRLSPHPPRNRVHAGVSLRPDLAIAFSAINGDKAGTGG
jgi:hypothetical protein